MTKKRILYILITIIFGIIIGMHIFNSYKNKTDESVFKSEENIYLLQYGVYTNKENMENNTKSLENYFYFNDNDGYHVIIGITKNGALKDKIVNAYKIEENIYMKKVIINNSEFLILLDEYDKLLEDITSNETIISAEKQILSKYEELILQDG